jgi:hypothetical protein
VQTEAVQKAQQRDQYCWLHCYAATCEEALQSYPARLRAKLATTCNPIPPSGAGRVLKLPYPKVEEKHRPGGDFASGRGKSLELAETPIHVQYDHRTDTKRSR